MPIEGLPPVSTPNSLPAPIENLGSKIVSLLSSPLTSKGGMMELAGRIYWIVALVIAAAIVCAVKFGPLLGRASSLSVAQSMRKIPAVQGSSSISPELQQILAALSEINKQFETLFSDLKQLHAANGLGSTIERSLKEFHEQFDQYKSQDEFQTEFKQFDHIETNFRYLKAMKESLFFAPIYVDLKGTIHQPSDGNCLYHALGAGLELLKDDPSLREARVDEPLEHWKLRDKVVTWMKSNIDTDDELKVYLDRAVGDYIEVRKGQYQAQRETLEALKAVGENISAASTSLTKAESELAQLETLERAQRHQWYLERAGQPNFFASVAEMYAFSKLYPQVSVHIWRELKDRYIDSFDTPFNQSPLTINLAYNLAGDHFNLYAPPA
ncbi:MAG TPA: hypothetical protein VFU89_07450 [Rhabdochlamydiaceae bacterium]|nr:hypothetical protein [Rhabdochlamydiaceae bacterium]